MLFCVEQSTGTMLPYAKYSIFIQVKYFYMYLFILQKKLGYKEFLIFQDDTSKATRGIIFASIVHVPKISFTNQCVDEVNDAYGI